MKKSFLLAMLLSIGVVSVLAQQGRGPRNLPPGDNIVGKVTAVNKDSLVIVPMAGGDPVTVKVGDDTRVMKQRQPIKLEEIKKDDTVFARGIQKDNVFQAIIVGLLTPEMAERLRQGGALGVMTNERGGPGGPGGAQVNPEDMGKKFISGEVKAILETKLTIARTDGQTQDIEVDENTSFRKNRESITLPDIKVGDFVFGRGELKDSVFVPRELNVMGPRRRAMQMGAEGNESQPKKSGGDQPPASSPPKN